MARRGFGPNCGSNWGHSMAIRVLGTLFAALFLTAWPLGVSAQESAEPKDEVFNDITGPDLIAILQQQGFAASLEQDSYGDPMIMAQAGGLHFSIITYGCNMEAEPACARLQMVAHFQLPDGASEYDIALMNAYNQRYLFGRAYIDPEGDATVDYTINLNQGVTADNVVDNLNIWVHVLHNFSVQGWSGASS